MLLRIYIYIYVCSFRFKINRKTAITQKSHEALGWRETDSEKHVVVNANSPPQSDDIDRTKRDKEQSQLDPRETSRHVEILKETPHQSFEWRSQPAPSYFLNT